MSLSDAHSVIYCTITANVINEFNAHVSDTKWHIPSSLITIKKSTDVGLAVSTYIDAFGDIILERIYIHYNISNKENLISMMVMDILNRVSIEIQKTQ